MKGISVTGYFGTGSSAVIDYIREFKNIKYIDSEMHLFINNGGLDELNYKMKNYPSILSGIAIYKFERLIKVLSEAGVYGEPFDSKVLWNGYFLKRSLEFIKNISNGYTDGFVEFNRVEKLGKFNKWEMKTLPKIKKCFYKYMLLKKNVNRDDFVIPKRRTYIPKTYDIYLKEQKKYISDLLNYLKTSPEEKVLFDHFLPIGILDNKKDYSDDLKVIIVDRDPRDIFILNLEKWKETFVPKNINDFVEWFKFNRKNKIRKNTEDILCLNFEDLIYKNRETTEKINSFLGLDKKDHINYKKYLDIDISINNTQLFNRYPEYQNEIKIIEENLKEYLYEFPIKINKKVEIIF